MCLRAAIATAVVGASGSSQLREVAEAAEIVLDLEVMRNIDEALGDIVDRDPAKAGKTYQVMARWRA